MCILPRAIGGHVSGRRAAHLPRRTHSPTSVASRITALAYARAAPRRSPAASSNMPLFFHARNPSLTSVGDAGEGEFVMSGCSSISVSTRAAAAASVLPRFKAAEYFCMSDVSSASMVLADDPFKRPAAPRATPWDGVESRKPCVIKASPPTLLLKAPPPPPPLDPSTWLMNLSRDTWDSGNAAMPSSMTDEH